MKGITVEMVASSWIEALGGLSRWVTLSVPPAFCADAGTALAATTRAAIEAAMNPRILFPPDLACLALLDRHAITSDARGVESEHANAWFAGRNGHGAGAAGRGAGLSHEADPDRGAVRAGNRHRHRGADRGRAALEPHRPTGGDREQAGRRGPDRRAGRRDGGARRLYALHHHPDHAGDGCPYLQVAALRPGEELRADLRPVAGRPGRHGEERAAGEDRRRTDRARA